MFTLYKIVFFDDLNVKSSVVLSAIYHINKSGKHFYLSILGEYLGISHDTMTRITKDLQAKEYITIKRFWDKNKKYAKYYYTCTDKTKILYQEEKARAKRLYKKIVETPDWYNKYKKELQRKTEYKEQEKPETTAELLALADELFGSDI